MAQLDKQRNEDGKRLLQLEHVLDNRNRELARIDIILVTHQKVCCFWVPILIL